LKTPTVPSDEEMATIQANAEIQAKRLWRRMADL
jgi:hypothetical protein